MRKSKVLPCYKGGICLKRRIFALMLCLCMVFGLALTVRADSAASSIQVYATVDDDGDADVTMTVRLRIETAVESLYFPLPLNATDIYLNDSKANFIRGTTSQDVNLGKDVAGYVGDHVLTFKFKVPNVVRMVEDPKTGKSRLTLELPLLSGFEYPVGSVSLAVTLPENVEGRPVFKSTYHQDSIDTILSYSITGNMITGIISQPLKDHETLSMTLLVPETMFDGVSTYVRVGNPELIPMLICALLALVYWLIFLRCYPLLKLRSATPPEGITAGEVSTRLTMGGADLTMTVLSWAQMGYLLIQLDDRGRVWLHKRMDMGNERSPFEVKIFRALFGKHRVVNGTGAHYAALADRVSRLNPGRKILNHPKCGNMLIFRVLACAAQVFCGVCYAMNFTGNMALQVILAIFLAGLGAGCGWLIQSGMYRIHLRGKVLLAGSLATGVLWVLLGLWAGPWGIGLIGVLIQLIAGLMAAYGGRRSTLGRQNACQLLGLHQYLRKVDRAELKRIQKNDPEYFFKMLPFAMALGVAIPFARRFGKQKLPQCPYFFCGVKNKMTAEDWVRFLQEAVSSLDERAKRMKWEKYAVIRFR